MIALLCGHGAHHEFDEAANKDSYGPPCRRYKAMAGMGMQQSVTENWFLRRLPTDTLERLVPAFEWVELSRGDQLLNSPVDSVYFPLNGLVSFVLMAQSGASSEIAIAGKEGLVGICVFLNSDSPVIPAVVQRPGRAIKLDGAVAAQHFGQDARFRQSILEYIRVFFRQVAQTALCNAHHSLEQRFCRWLLLFRDRLDEHDHVAMTQEMIANMLGVRREAVTRVAHQLKERQLIDYGTRRIEIRNRQGLLEASCECYDILRKEYALLSSR